MAATSHTSHEGLATPPMTPPALSKADELANVYSLATQFGACVEAFNLIHPHKDSDHAQKVALAKLGLQQGRLLIFGDAVGISSPPAHIATHMIPSHPGLTNPDPNLPVNFGVRDPKLDDEAMNKKVRAALDEIAGRPSHLTREELMEKYGLKSPKRVGSVGYPALDHSRLESFREKYALLLDLVRQTGIRAGIKRGMSMATQHWIVRDALKFDAFVATVRTEVDGLIALMDVRAQVDRGMRTDIRAMGWHPDLTGPIVRQDWEKLKLIREACSEDYPEYIEVTETAMNYISDELKGTALAGLRASYQPATPERRKSDETTKEPSVSVHAHEKGKEKRPGFFSKLKSWNKSSNKAPRQRSKSIASTGDVEEPQRSMSADDSKPSNKTEGEGNGLERVRSKSLSAMSDDTAPFDMGSRLENVPTQSSTSEEEAGIPIRTSNTLTHADTVNSLIERHDMFKGMGRVETKDIRAKAHDWAM